MVLLQCVTWSFHTEDPADGRLLHAAPPMDLKPHHHRGLSSWGDPNQRFHAYDRVPTTASIEDLVAEIDRNPNAIFWG